MNMKGRTEEEPPDPIKDMDDKRPDGSVGHECLGGGKHEGVQESSMMECVLDRENLNRAWQRVRANHGAPGIDGMTIEQFPAFFRENWERLHSALMEGTYRPAAVRRVFIPKPDGAQRPLGVPTVLDRVIQQALAQVLNPLFESGFSDHSYGFREERNAHQAVREVEACWKDRRRHAADCDLKSFFDTVNHDRLMEQLRGKVRDRKVLALIRRYLEAGVVRPDGTRDATPQGVPQGGPLSPLLANIVLDPLDKELERRGHRFARYADDFLIMVRSAKAAQRVKESVTRFVEGTLKLVVNRAKSQSAPLKQCTFLGFQIGARGKVVWTAKVQERFKQRVREITSRNRGHRVQDVVAELGRYVLGWLGYFGISHTYRVLLELEEWVRRRVRLYYWKQWKRPGTRRRHLRALGISKERVKLASRSRKGYWRMSGNSVVQCALTNRWLKEQGVPDMRAKWVAIHYPDQQGV
jgi:RNA-directed DNA polymerase